MRTYFLRSFGCQMNDHDAERIRADAEAIELALSNPATRTRDLGGTLGTEAFTDIVLRTVRG